MWVVECGDVGIGWRGFLRYDSEKFVSIDLTNKCKHP